jgi:hypothetical protein
MTSLIGASAADMLPAQRRRRRRRKPGGVSLGPLPGPELAVCGFGSSD